MHVRGHVVGLRYLPAGAPPCATRVPRHPRPLAPHRCLQTRPDKRRGHPLNVSFPPAFMLTYVVLQTLHRRRPLRRGRLPLPPDAPFRAARACFKCQVHPMYNTYRFPAVLRFALPVVTVSSMTACCGCRWTTKVEEGGTCVDDQVVVVTAGVAILFPLTDDAGPTPPTRGSEIWKWRAHVPRSSPQLPHFLTPTWTWLAVFRSLTGGGGIRHWLAHPPAPPADSLSCLAHPSPNKPRTWVTSVLKFTFSASPPPLTS